MHEVRFDKDAPSTHVGEKYADNKVAEDVSCAHCGDPCPDVPVVSGDLLFCCYGCKAVHELLEQAGLSDHYKTASLENPSITSMVVCARKEVAAPAQIAC